MNRLLIEVCCGSADDAIAAQAGGADRIELNSNLFHGGLTPSVGTLDIVKSRLTIPVMAMVRPRQGGFCYTDVEFEVMKADLRALIAHGADGIVTGVLRADGTIDEDRSARLRDIAGDKPCVFHRAIDVTPDWKRALETLIRLGFTRVLTSGQESDVFFGMETVRDMRLFAGDAIEILPGAGVTAKNARRVAEITGCGQLHVAAFRACRDSSTENNRGIYYGGALYPSETLYDVIDSDYIARVRENAAFS
jgi:copper homeostasis protein